MELWNSRGHFDLLDDNWIHLWMSCPPPTSTSSTCWNHIWYLFAFFCVLHIFHRFYFLFPHALHLITNWLQFVVKFMSGMMWSHQGGKLFLFCWEIKSFNKRSHFPAKSYDKNQMKILSIIFIASLIHCVFPFVSSAFLQKQVAGNLFLSLSNV